MDAVIQDQRTFRRGLIVPVALRLFHVSATKMLLEFRLLAQIIWCEEFFHLLF